VKCYVRNAAFVKVLNCVIFKCIPSENWWWAFERIMRVSKGWLGSWWKRYINELCILYSIIHWVLWIEKRLALSFPWTNTFESAVVHKKIVRNPIISINWAVSFRQYSSNCSNSSNIEDTIEDFEVSSFLYQCYKKFKVEVTIF